MYYTIFSRKKYKEIKQQTWNEWVTPLIIPIGQHTFLKGRKEANIYSEPTMWYACSHLALTLVITL